MSTEPPPAYTNVDAISICQSEKSQQRGSTRVTQTEPILEGPKIGYTEEELEIVRNSLFWKLIRYTLFFLFWLLWAGFLTGTTLIVVFNNGDVTTTASPSTTSITKTPKQASY